MATTPASQPLHTTALPGEEQMDPVEVTFDTAVTTVSVHGFGAFSCTGAQQGKLTAYNAVGVVVATAQMQMREPDDCGEDEITYGAFATVSAAAQIRRVKIEAPEPWDFPVFVDGQFCCTGHTSADYTLILSPVPQGPPPAEVVDIGCPTSVTRGSTVSCPISVPSGRACRVVSLSATVDGTTRPLAVPNPAVPPGGSFALSGPAVASTDISVAVDIDMGGGQTRRATRVGSFTTVARTMTLVAPEPTAQIVGDGGLQQVSALFLSPYDGGTTAVTQPYGPLRDRIGVAFAAGGPNAGLAYISSMGDLPRTDIFVNPLADQGQWPDDQNGGQFTDASGITRNGCTQAQFRNILFPRILLHEGLPAIRSRSHVVDYRNALPTFAVLVASTYRFAATEAAARDALRQHVIDTYGTWYANVYTPIFRAFDATEGSGIWVNGFSCMWDFNRNDP